jgi:hypothetical protein
MAITGILFAFEASVAAPRADATAPTVDATAITVDALNVGDVAAFTGTVGVGGITGVLAATEGADTAAFTGQVAELPVYGGGGLPWVPPLEPIEGVGYGILPELAGEAHGVVLAAGIGGAMLRNLAGEAAGAVGARGHSEGQLRVQAAASGARMAKGAAAAGLDLGVAGSGAVVARGNGLAVIGNFEIIATGRQDDDEAAIVWLLAA